MPKGLTIRQEKFCNIYLECGNASEAYRQAYPNSEKWKDKTVNEAASRLLNISKVYTRVEELKTRQAQKSEVKREEIIELLTNVLRGASITDSIEKGPGGSRARTIAKTWAVERICKMLGYDAPLEAKVKVTGVGLSKEELLSEIERIRKARSEQ